MDVFGFYYINIIEDRVVVRLTKDTIIAIISVVMLYCVMELCGITCPIKYITGISCAGCGMSRAWIALLHLDIKNALYYHPLFWLPPLVVIIFFIKPKINIKFYKFFIFTAVSAFVIVYICRMIAGDGDIVVFEPNNNIICRIIQKVKN